MIPKTDGDATPLGQRPLGVLPLVYRIWASAGMVQLESWFQPWVPDSVFGAGGGRSSVEAWYTTAPAIEKAFSGVVDSDIHLFVADVIKSFDIVDRGLLDKGSGMLILSITPMFGCASSLLLGWVSLGRGMVVSLRGARSV